VKKKRKEKGGKMVFFQEGNMSSLCRVAECRAETTLESMGNGRKTESINRGSRYFPNPALFDVSTEFAQ
jgi:hypothetical protein